jgi:hypothetical protein
MRNRAIKTMPAAARQQPRPQSNQHSGSALPHGRRTSPDRPTTNGRRHARRRPAAEPAVTRYKVAITFLAAAAFGVVLFYYAVIDVYDRGTKIASFRHDGLPPEAFEERAGVGRGKFATSFWANATDLLLHDNVWTRLLGRIAPSYFPESELQAFFWKVAGRG